MRTRRTRPFLLSENSNNQLQLEADLSAREEYEMQPKPGRSRVFDKILIANRGEIAIRVIRTCKEFGIDTVAVYSEFDRNARHVRMAGEAVCLGGNLPSESYLNTDKVLAAMEATGAQAIHPGYGFLAENAAFAVQVAEAGKVWIGPPAKAIVEMGDKVSSRHAAVAAGFPPIPGTNDPITSADEIVAFGETHSWPVAVKASYGGGGKGIRVAYSAEDATACLAASQREALAYFGNDECYIERYLEHPRHVEVQILGDSHGNMVWLGERDCSVQRRHQKVVEETPSPAITPELRRRMGEDAVKVAKQVGYVNADTVECLAQDGEYWFLEMNTRLQVEHCITEEVCGIDLVEAQLRIAAGEKLWFSQKDVAARGHAFELRVNAEDPTQNFLPTPGKITCHTAPGGAGIRLDAGYGTGDEISQFYDNLVAKLVVWGENREQARRRALRALNEIEFAGLTTNIPLHRTVLQHPDFIAGTISTKWLENSVDLSVLHTDSSPQTTGAPADNTPEETEPVVERNATVEVNGKRFDVRMFLPASQAGNPGEEAATAQPKRRKGKGGHGGQGGDGNGTVVSPMQGTVLEVLVEEGQEIQAGNPILILEAMKMENKINAEADGIVAEITVAPGDTVAAGDVLAVIK